MKTQALLLFLPLVGGVAGAQSEYVEFRHDSGLAAEAAFTLLGDGSQLEIRVRNLSTGAPHWFGKTDQLVSGLSFDLGQAGEKHSDPRIVGGTIRTGDASMSLNFDRIDVGPGEDVSGEFGYGNHGSYHMLPNLISTTSNGTTRFDGLNLNGSNGLGGPVPGLVAQVPVVSLRHVAAIQDEIVATLELDEPLADLDFLAENGTVLEFGCHSLFLCGDTGCEEDPSVVQVDDAGGLNLSGGLAGTPGSDPTRGNPEWCLDMDDIDGQCVSPGAMTFVFLSANTAALRVPRFGCAPGSAGEIMIDPTLVGMVGGPISWSGPGEPATHCFAIPDDPSVCGLVCFGQGLFLDPQGGSAPGVLTNRVDITVGS